jgi:hypothetical protein
MPVDRSAGANTNGGRANCIDLLLPKDDARAVIGFAFPPPEPSSLVAVTPLLPVATPPVLIVAPAPTVVTLPLSPRSPSLNSKGFFAKLITCAVIAAALGAVSSDGAHKGRALLTAAAAADDEAVSGAVRESALAALATTSRTRAVAAVVTPPLAVASDAAAAALADALPPVGAVRLLRAVAVADVPLLVAEGLVRVAVVDALSVDVEDVARAVDAEELVRDEAPPVLAEDVLETGWRSLTGFCSIPWMSKNTMRVDSSTEIVRTLHE